MIQVRLSYEGRILVGIESRGHSGYSQKGSDIICAAVSVLMQSMIFGLEDIAHVHGLKIETDEKVPLMRATWPESEQERISLLTTTTAESLKIIAQSNPGYVKIITEEK